MCHSLRSVFPDITFGCCTCFTVAKILQILTMRAVDLGSGGLYCREQDVVDDSST